MIQHSLSLFAALLFLLGVQPLAGDTFLPATPVAATSPDGRTVVRAVPVENGDAASVAGYQLTDAEDGYRRIFSFRSNLMPQHIFLCNEGRHLVFIDYYGGSGMGPNVISILDRTGAATKTWALRDFYRKEDLPKLGRSSSMIFWKGAVTQLDDFTILIERPRFRKSDATLADYVLHLRDQRIEVLAD